MIEPIGPIFQQTSEENENEIRSEIKVPESSNRDLSKDWNTVRKGGSLKEQTTSVAPQAENWMNIIPESNRQVLDFNLMQRNVTCFSKSKNSYLDLDDEDKKDSSGWTNQSGIENKTQETSLSMARRLALARVEELKTERMNQLVDEYEQNSGKKKLSLLEENKLRKLKEAEEEESKKKRKREDKGKDKGKDKDKHKHKHKKSKKDKKDKKDKTGDDKKKEVPKYQPTWDRDRDLFGNNDPNKLKGMVREAEQLNSKFESGSYL
jgi:hypothetical protein